MSLRKATHTGTTFALTLLLAGLLHAVAEGHGYGDADAVLDHGYSEQISLSVPDDWLEKAVPRALAVNAKKYQRKSQPTPDNDTPSDHAVRWSFPAHGAVTDSSTLPLPWFISRSSRSASRISSWKDSNVLYKSQAIQHA